MIPVVPQFIFFRRELNVKFVYLSSFEYIPDCYCLPLRHLPCVQTNRIIIPYFVPENNGTFGLASGNNSIYSSPCQIISTNFSGDIARTLRRRIVLDVPRDNIVNLAAVCAAGYNCVLIILDFRSQRIHAVTRSNVKNIKKLTQL